MESDLKENASIFDQIEEAQKPTIIFKFATSHTKYHEIQNEIIHSFTATLFLSIDLEYNYIFYLTQNFLYKCTVK